MVRTYFIVAYAFDVPSRYSVVIRRRWMPRTFDNIVIQLHLGLFPLFPFIIKHFKPVKILMFVVNNVLIEFKKGFVIRLMGAILIVAKRKTNTELKINRIFTWWFPFESAK